MKTYTTRDDLIQIRGQIDQIITKKELQIIAKKELSKEMPNDTDTDSTNLALFRAVFAILDFIIRKTWGL